MRGLSLELSQIGSDDSDSESDGGEDVRDVEDLDGELYEALEASALADTYRGYGDWEHLSDDFTHKLYIDQQTIALSLRSQPSSSPTRRTRSRSPTKRR
jgi:hypothetical protein